MRRSMPLIAVLFAMSIAWPCVSPANQGLVVRDQSMGDGRGSAVGPGQDSGGAFADYLIESNMGTARGENLFHSFDQFSIGQGEIAAFNNLTGQAGDPNRTAIPFSRVIARVTGSQISEIEGLIRSRVSKADSSGADFIFLNSNGIVFGPTGSLDLASAFGSFSVSTASGLEFADGDFQTTDVDTPWGPSPCCTGPPTAYLFTGANPATPNDPAEIRIGTRLGAGTPPDTNPYNFSVPAGESVNAVGGTVTVDDGRIILTGGSVRFAATGHAAVRVPIDIASDGPWRSSLGNEAVIRLGPGSIVTTSNPSLAPGGGSVVLRGGRLELEGAAVSAGGPDGGGVDLGFTGDVALKAFRFGPLVFPSSIIDRSSGPLANGIRLEAGSLSLNDFARIVSTEGDLVIRSPGSVRLENGASIQTVTRYNGSGAADAGDIHLDAGSLDLLSGGQIASLTGQDPNTPDGQAAGDIDIVVQDAFRIAGGLDVDDPGTGQTLIQRSGVLARALDGATADARGGNIDIKTGSLEMSRSASISASARNAAAAGKIEIRADTSIRLTGGVQLAGEELTEISSRGVEGGAGDLLLTAPQIEVLDGAAISATSQIAGNGGNVTIIADRLRVSGYSTPGAGLASPPQSSAIYSEAPRLAGEAGNLDITLEEALEVSNGGVLSVRTQGSGSAGKVIVRVEGGSIEITSGGLVLSESAGTGAQAGAAGSLMLFAAEDFRITDGGTLAATARTVDAGDIRLEAGGDLTMIDGLVTTRSGSALGGDIELDAGSLVHLIRSAVETDVGGLGNGGNIRLGQGSFRVPNPPHFAVLNASRLTATAEKNQGGFISISADLYLESPGSRVDASSGDPTKDGIVELIAPEFEVSGNLEVLPSAYLDVSVVLQEHCAERRNDQGSSLILADRPNIGPEPGGYLPASVLASGLSTAAPSRSPSATSPKPRTRPTAPLALPAQLAAFDARCGKPGGAFGFIEH